MSKETQLFKCHPCRTRWHQKYVFTVWRKIRLSASLTQVLCCLKRGGLLSEIVNEWVKKSFHLEPVNVLCGALRAYRCTLESVEWALMANLPYAPETALLWWKNPGTSGWSQTFDIGQSRRFRIMRCKYIRKKKIKGTIYWVAKVCE